MDAGTGFVAEKESINERLNGRWRKAGAEWCGLW
jgi:hypothetical protein